MIKTSMEYKEYRAKIEGIEKKLGVLGEIHSYTYDEYRRVKDIIPQFDTVAVEGSKGMTPVAWIGALYIPSIFAFLAATKRSLKDRGETLAEKYQKKVIRMEENESQLFPVKQKLALIVAGTVSIVMSPFVYGYYRKNGDPYTKGTIAYEKRIANQKKEEKGLETFYLIFLVECGFQKKQNI